MPLEYGYPVEKLTKNISRRQNLHTEFQFFRKIEELITQCRNHNNVSKENSTQYTVCNTIALLV